ncbi:tandem-type lipoprotein [Staphylococcus hyicus]|uniref:tandem-type lipoprotein n=1 Tax=Staphylococcus hyicus TaxID=1284 RepID=UPI001430473A|nr:tandem-type lipoprotein [Staphylococcus hyicus]NJI00723.1 tandem-type lipoprotein [Staphylococcus hyicus]
MKLMKKIIIIAGLMMTIGLLSSCGMSTREKIESGLKEPLSVYPTKNLEDFYDKEGYRDSSFSKDDKGVWSVYTSIATRNDEGKLKTEGVILFIDRNTRTSKGYYYVDNESKDDRKNVEKEYPLIMKNNQLILKDKNVDEDIKRKVKDFKFFVQFANFKDLNSYGQGHFDYNPNVPSYSAEYELSNEDENVKQLRKRYDIPTDKGPKLVLKGVGEFTGSSIGYKNLEIVFEQNEDEDIYYGDMVDYQPSGE